MINTIHFRHRKLFHGTSKKFKFDAASETISKLFNCPFCGNVVPQAKDLVNHITLDHGDKEMTLLTAPCCRSSLPMEQFESHCNQCFSTTCQYCEKLIREPTKMLGHKRREHAVWRHSCPLCSHVAMLPKDIVSHVMEFHGAEDTLPNIICPCCHQRIPPESYHEHCVGDSGKPGCFANWGSMWVCYQCNVPVPKSTFNKHIVSGCPKSRKGAKRFPCPFCPTVIEAGKSSLILHLVNEHSYGAHVCSHCLFACGSPKSLRVHYNEAHSTGMRLEMMVAECPRCTKAVPVGDDYENHCANCLRINVTHGNDGKYKNVSCEDCGQKFNGTRYLMEHRRRKHTVGKFDCKECGWSGDTWTKLNKYNGNH